MKRPLFDDQGEYIDGLARDHLADADLCPEAEDRLRRELETRFARQRVRRRRISSVVAASFAILISLVALKTDVVSQAVKYLFSGRFENGIPVLEAEGTKKRFGSALDSTHTVEEHIEFVEKAVETYRAGAWKVSNVWGWTLRDLTSYVITYDVEIDGETYNYYETWPEEGLSETAIQDKEAFYAGPQNDMIADIQAGTAQTAPSETVAILGRLYEFDKYTANYPGWGTVVIWIAIPSD